MLHDPLVLACRIDQQATLVKDVAGRLFNIDILTGEQGRDGNRAMPVMWRGNHHRVNGVVVDDRTKVTRGPWRVALDRFHLVDSLFQYRFVDVAQSNEASTLVGCDLVDVVEPHAVKANHGNGDLVVYGRTGCKK